MFVKGGGEQEKGADIDEHFDWHMTHGTYQMREDPGDGRRSDYLSRVKMESTTTNFRQSNERLKNRFMHFFLQFNFIEIRYISANVCCLFGFLCLCSGQSHLHLYQSMEHICLFRCKQTGLHTQTWTHVHTGRAPSSHSVCFPVLSWLFDTRPFCSCLRACAEHLEDEWVNTHHTNIGPLIVIGLDGLGVEAVAQ